MDSADKIIIVDDDPVIRGLLVDVLSGLGYVCFEAQNGAELFRHMDGHCISLVLLDIKLPDEDGLTLLPEILRKDEDVCVVIMTGVVDIKIAISAIRAGAFDYVTKPFTVDELRVVVTRALDKRRLEIENRNYQRSIEQKNLRLEILHRLSLKIAYSLLSTLELEEMLRTILVGITAGEGLGLNRAFLALFDPEDSAFLRGKLAIGPDSPEEAGRIWATLQERKFTLTQAIEECGRACQFENTKVNQIVREIVVPSTDFDHILIRSVNERKSFNVIKGHTDGVQIRPEIMRLLGTGDFAVVPLCSPDRVSGVILADNFITHKPIQDEDIAAMELFANQASLAIEKSRLYSELAAKISMLETANRELKESRDLLIRAERLSALGEMAAQIAHEMRNPLASIGGLARFLQRHTSEDKHTKHLDTIVKETKRLEEILSQIFTFIQHPQIILAELNVNEIVASCLKALESQFVKSHIKLEAQLAPDMPDTDMDGDQITQALMNIFRNSVDAMPKGGTMQVKTQFSQGDIMIEILDTGVGMSKTDLERARQPFFTTKTYGVGLGLTIAEKIIKAHRGSLHLTGELGRGVRVVITLPRSPQAN